MFLLVGSQNLKRLPFEFDFTKHEIWTDPLFRHNDAHLSMNVVESKIRIELMASGRLRIEKGTVSFRRNWNTGRLILQDGKY